MARRSGQRVLNSFVRFGEAKKQLRNGESQGKTRKIFLNLRKKILSSLTFDKLKRLSLKKIKKIKKNCSKKKVLWNNNSIGKKRKKKA